MLCVLLLIWIAISAVQNPCSCGFCAGIYMRSDQSADRGDFKAESDAASVALFFCAKTITLCGKSQSVKPRVRAEPDEPEAPSFAWFSIMPFLFLMDSLQVMRIE